MKYSFYQSNVDSIPVDNTIYVKENTKDEEPSSNKTVHRFHHSPAEAGARKEKTDAPKPSSNKNVTETPESVNHFSAESTQVVVQENANKQEFTSGKKVHQFYEPSETQEGTIPLLVSFPMKAEQDLINTSEQVPSLNEKVHQFYQPSEAHESNLSNTKDVKENTNEQKPRSHKNVHQFYQTSEESGDSEEMTDAPEPPSNENVHKLNETPGSITHFSTETTQDAKDNSNKQEHASGKKVHQFYEPKESPVGTVSLLESLTMKTDQDVITTSKQESLSNEKVHQFYQPSEEPESKFSLHDSSSVENKQHVKARGNEHESQLNKNLHQFYQAAETREDCMSLHVAAVTTRFASPPVEKASTNEHEPSPNNEMQECLDNMLDNVDELCQPIKATESNISLDGAAFTIRSTTCNIYEQNGESYPEKPAHDVEEISKEQEDPAIKNLHQFYLPSDESKSPITLSLKDCTTRSARKAHLTSLNLGLMENLALLQSYHESKKAEVTLLEKYGLRS